MGTETQRGVGQRENGLAKYEARVSDMSIEALMTAVDAAGYVMVAEDDLPEAFGADTVSKQNEAHESSALTVWQPVLAAAGNRSAVHSHISNAWSWVVGRFASGATA